LRCLYYAQWRNQARQPRKVEANSVRVAIDGQFRSLPPSGTGAYLEALFHELPRISPEDSFVLVERPGRLGPKVLPERIRTDARLLRSQWELAGFERASRTHAPDLLHIPSFAAPLRSATPFVVTMHDAIPFVLPAYRASAPMRVHLALMRQTARRATLVLTPSNAAAEDLHRYLGVPEGKIRVTPEAADASYRPSLNRELDQAVAARFGITGPYIFNVGGLDVRKRVDLLIEAFAGARNRLPADTKLVIGGRAHSGNPTVFPDLQPLVERLGVADHVVFTGWITDAEKLALYQGATIYATPSIYEGFGLTPLEAMACGAPVIASNRTSLPEVIGSAGLLIEPDVDAWQSAIVDLMTNDARRAEFTRLGLQRASTFTWQRTAELTVAAYHEAFELNQRGA
jgi:glycosyltransferase involved in cell wall biosynthesis